MLPTYLPQFHCELLKLEVNHKSVNTIIIEKNYFQYNWKNTKRLPSQGWNQIFERRFGLFYTQISQLNYYIAGFNDILVNNYKYQQNIM